MTIAPLPTPVATAPGTGSTGAGSSGSSGSSADVFATLVEAVLGAATGNAHTTGTPSSMRRPAPRMLYASS